MRKFSNIIVIAVIFIWVGMICGISFLEAPLKFQAPGITLELGLGIGKIVFGALTKIEIIFSLLLIAFLNLSQLKLKTWALFLIPMLIVIVDNAFLMPILDRRVEMILNGQTPAESSVHWWYVGLEVLKVGALLYGGLIFLSKRLSPI
jgi:hypothetical protein